MQLSSTIETAGGLICTQKRKGKAQNYSFPSRQQEIFYCLKKHRSQVKTMKSGHTDSPPTAE